MSLFDYSAAKEALREAGHHVSAGSHMLASDLHELAKFGRRMFGLTATRVAQGTANPALLPAGFPGVAAAPIAEVEEAPEKPAEAEVVPAEPVSDKKPSKKAAAEAKVEVAKPEVVEAPVEKPAEPVEKADEGDQAAK